MKTVKEMVGAVLGVILLAVIVVGAILGSLLLVALVGLFFAAPFAGIALGILLPLHWFGVI